MATIGYDPAPCCPNVLHGSIIPGKDPTVYGCFPQQTRKRQRVRVYRDEIGPMLFGDLARFSVHRLGAALGCRFV